MEIPKNQKELKGMAATMRQNVSDLAKKRDKLWSNDMSRKLEDMLKIKTGELHKKIITGKCEPDKYNYLQLSLKDLELVDKAIAWQKEVSTITEEIDYILKQVDVLIKLCENEHPDRRTFEDYFKCDDCGLVIDNTPPKHF